MMNEPKSKSINFTVVPDEPQEGAGSGAADGGQTVERVYANFCAVTHTPFDFTLTFCEMPPLREEDVANAPEGSNRTIRAPVKAKLVIPVQLVPALAAALSENLRIYQNAYSNVGFSKGRLGGKVH
jgi:hypothetical protein